MTFTGEPRQECARMVGACFAVTGNSAETAKRLRPIVEALGGVPIEIAEEHRALYHAALCHSANHLVTLLVGALNALSSIGVRDPAALIAPLVRASLENTLDRGIQALSGPLKRGDAGTVRAHLEALGKCAPELLPAYRAMALATLDSLANVNGEEAPEDPLDVHH